MSGLVGMLQRWWGAAHRSPAALLALGATGIVIAALGQAATTRTVPSALSWLAFFHDRLRGVSEPVAAAMVLLAGASLPAKAQPNA